MIPEIQELRELANRRAALYQSGKDFCLFVILPLFAGFAIEGFL